MTFQLVPGRAVLVPLGGERAWRLPLESVALLLLVAAAALFRLFNLAAWSLWIDELHTLHVALTASLTTAGVPGDQHPPLYYLFMQYWVNWGQGELWLRIPSAIGGVLAVFLMWRTGVAWERRDLGLLAAALLAFSALHIWYSREARMYGPVTFFWAASIYYSVQLWRRDRWLDGLGLAAATLGGLLMAYPTLALWAGQGVIFLAAALFQGWRAHAGRLFRWMISQLLIVAGFMAWMPYLLLQLRGATVFRWHLPGMPQAGFSGTLEETLRLALLVGSIALVAILVGTLALSRQRALRRHWQRLATPTAVFIVVLFLALLVVGALPRGLSLRRQLLVFWLPLLLLGAWAILQLRRPWLVGAFLILSFFLGLAPVLGAPYQDWRGAARLLEQKAVAGDLILLTPGWSRTAFDYYYQGDIAYQGAHSDNLAASHSLAAGDTVWLVSDNHPALMSYNTAAQAWFSRQAVAEESYLLPQYLVVTKYRVK